jgi:hypothetical protein
VKLAGRAEEGEATAVFCIFSADYNDARERRRRKATSERGYAYSNLGGEG